MERKDSGHEQKARLQSTAVDSVPITILTAHGRILVGPMHEVVLEPMYSLLGRGVMCRKLQDNKVYSIEADINDDLPILEDEVDNDSLSDESNIKFAPPQVSRYDHSK